MFAIVAAALGLILAAPSAGAQSDDVVVEVSGPDIRLMTAAQARLAELEEDYQSINLRPQRAGFGIAASLAGIGGFMLVPGAAYLGTSWDPPPAAKALVAGGAILFVSGIVALPIVSRRLKRKKQERLRLEQEMAPLRLYVETQGVPRSR